MPRLIITLLLLIVGQSDLASLQVLSEGFLAHVDTTPGSMNDIPWYKHPEDSPTPDAVVEAIPYVPRPTNPSQPPRLVGLNVFRVGRKLGAQNWPAQSKLDWEAGTIPRALMDKVRPPSAVNHPLQNAAMSPSSVVSVIAQSLYRLTSPSGNG